jgi:formylmethanofuran dehydrogenase subunit C
VSEGAVVLVPRTAPDVPVEVECIAPERLATLAEREIATLPVWHGGGTRAAALGDFFIVRGGREATVRIDGDVRWAHGLGAAMAGGSLLIDGGVGDGVGARMTGGTIEVRGDAGDDAGVAMAGGVLRIGGSAGDRLGAALPGASRGATGGEIVVAGSAGALAGAAARRVLIVVGGDVGPDAARAMIAGNLVVLGSAAAGAGRWSKRGTLVVMGEVTISPTYLFSCTYRPPHVRLMLTYLRDRYAIAIDDRQVRGDYRRYSGDMAELGKGEILQWTTSSTGSS